MERQYNIPSGDCVNAIDLDFNADSGCGEDGIANAKVGIRSIGCKSDIGYYNSGNRGLGRGERDEKRLKLRGRRRNLSAASGDT